ncbi:hypothetical protein [Pseudomonas sp. CGJS7]|uniref:hypothetical protein n=1 Tax=Pseudomonas sp. CGJS7 TaxID=3109348 RepID=UPI00300BA9DE
MQKGYTKRILATAALAASLSAIFAATAQTNAHVEIRTYRDNTGQVIGVQYISRGCADPQPTGWGVTTGPYSVDRGRCFVIAPPGGGPVN